MRVPSKNNSVDETLLGVPRGYAPLVAGRAREGEAVSPKGERWKGESVAVPPPRRLMKARSLMTLRTYLMEENQFLNKLDENSVFLDERELPEMNQSFELK
jgi:hypothetical protein